MSFVLTHRFRSKDDDDEEDKDPEKKKMLEKLSGKFTRFTLRFRAAHSVTHFMKTRSEIEGFFQGLFYLNKTIHNNFREAN